MKIALGCDHRGFRLKDRIKEYLRQSGHEIVDCGVFSEASSDYPDTAYATARCVADGTCERGILLCGSGIGMSITANKVRGIRAALCHDEITAEMARRHNDANILCLPADLISETQSRRLIDIFLTAPFDGGRHERRVNKIMALEAQECEEFARRRGSGASEVLQPPRATLEPLEDPLRLRPQG